MLRISDRLGTRGAVPPPCPPATAPLIAILTAVMIVVLVFSYSLDIFPIPMFIRTWMKTKTVADPSFFVNLLKPVVEERRKNPTNVSLVD